MITATVWNRDKAGSTLESLRLAEIKLNGSLSSEILARDKGHLKEILAAIYNETDIDLCFVITEAKMGIEDIIRGYYQLTCFNSNHYNNYYEALCSNAAYTTGSTIDTLSTEGGSGGLLDMIEVIKIIDECLDGNGTGIISGIVTDQGLFITLDELLSIIKLEDTRS